MYFTLSCAHICPDTFEVSVAALVQIIALVELLVKENKIQLYKTKNENKTASIPHKEKTPIEIEDNRTLLYSSHQRLDEK